MDPWPYRKTNMFFGFSLDYFVLLLWICVLIMINEVWIWEEAICAGDSHLWASRQRWPARVCFLVRNLTFRVQYLKVCLLVRDKTLEKTFWIQYLTVENTCRYHNATMINFQPGITVATELIGSHSHILCETASFDIFRF